MKTIEIVYYNNETPQFAESSEFQEIPETWEELKELCIEMCKYVFNEGYKTEYIVVKHNYFTADGKIFNYDWKCFADNLTPKRQWQIINSLVEE